MALAIIIIACVLMSLFLFACLRLNDAADDFADRLMDGDEGILTHFHNETDSVKGQDRG
jgi:hypothetical protein